MRGRQWEHTLKSKSTHFNKLTPQISNSFKKSTPLNNFHHRFVDCRFTDRRHLAIKTTTVHHIESRNFETCYLLWIVAAVDDADEQKLLHPLTFKPHHCNLPGNFKLRNFHSCKSSLISFHSTEFNFDKIVVPLSTAKVLSDNTMFVLLGGGKLIGRPFLVEGQQSTLPWFRFSDKRFDDIIVCGRKDKKIYVVDRLGKLHLLCNNVTSRVLRFNTAIDSLPLEGFSGRVGWRKRLVEGFRSLYLVVRVEGKFFRVYELVREYKSPYCWNEVKSFLGDVLFVSKDCCFFTSHFGGREYENCIVFSESGFPKYGDDSWEYNGNAEIQVFRMSDGRYGKVGESAEFPEIDWSPPSWVLDGGSRSSVHPRSQTEGEPDEVDEGEQSYSNNSNSEDEEEQEVMELDSDSHDQEQEEGLDTDVHDPEGGKLQCDSNSHETEDEEMHSDADIDEDASLKEDVPPSIYASVSAVEEEVAQTLHRINGGNDSTGKDTSRTNVTPSAFRPCISSKTKSCQNDSATAKFEGFDVRSDVVPTLQKIWQNHGNILENSTIRNSDIIGRALESLATMVQTLEKNPIQSLSDDQVDYLSTALSDLKIMSFKVQWLSSFVEKAVKLHKTKALVDSLNKLGHLSTKVQERKDILLDEIAKLTEEENKLKKEMAKVFKLIPFSGQVKFDEPLGSGLT